MLLLSLNVPSSSTSSTAAPTDTPSLKVLLCGRSRGHLDASPQADGRGRRQREQHTQANAQTPDGLELQARGLAGVHPFKGIAADSLDIDEE